MLDEVRRRIRRLVRKARKPREIEREEAEAERAPEERRPPEAAPEEPADYGLPVTERERRHDGWSAIRPRRPGEDTDVGRDMIPDITDAGRDLLPDPEEEECDDGDQRGRKDGGGPPSSGST